jgi:NAD(P)-dependent dehydrogenase (short-subunit alcohol dehydrogenase family)
MDGLRVEELFGVSGRVALVTGGATGIGQMFVRGLVANGASVYIVSRKAESCEQQAATLTQIGPGKAFALPAADLCTLKGCEAAAASLNEREIILHLLVNNSGTAWGEPLDAPGEHGFSRTMALNVSASFHLTRCLLPLLEAGSTPDRPSTVVNVGSVRMRFRTIVSLL